MPAARTRASKSPKPKKTVAATRTTLPVVMKTLEKSGSEQTRKTYRRHGAPEPVFGVSFATLGGLVKQIGVDHELALSLWDTGNFDARNLAFKIADPVQMTSSDLDRWARETSVRMCGGYVSMLAVEGSKGQATAVRWLASREDRLRAAGWGVVAQLAARDEAVPEAWLAEKLAEIERTIHAAPNAHREAMNLALITIGGRSGALRKSALAAAKKVGKVEVDHGDTACKTPDAGAYIEKMWAHAKAKKFESPSAQERQRESPRTRC